MRRNESAEAGVGGYEILLLCLPFDYYSDRQYVEILRRNDYSARPAPTTPRRSINRHSCGYSCGRWCGILAEVSTAARATIPSAAIIPSNAPVVPPRPRLPPCGHWSSSTPVAARPSASCSCRRTSRSLLLWLCVEPDDAALGDEGDGRSSPLAPSI